MYYDEKLFINPPFSKMKQVAEYIKELYNNRNEILLLIPARTDTQYFQDLMLLSPSIHFFKGRLHYNDSNSAPFPTICLHFKKCWLKIQVYSYGDEDNFLKLIGGKNA